MALIGNIKDLRLANIIQINCIERNVACAFVEGENNRGVMYFGNGNILHAEYGPFSGERAVHEMLTLEDGSFRVESDVPTPIRSITKNWNSIVLEGMRLQDEKNAPGGISLQSVYTQLSGFKNVKNVFILDPNGMVIEGDERNINPKIPAFIWYKTKKILYLFYTEVFQHIMLNKKDGYFFCFEADHKLVVVETNLHVQMAVFPESVREVLKQMVSN